MKKKADFLQPRDLTLLKHWLVGGAALGGSAALGTSLINYIRGLKEEAEAGDGKDDEDTLYINMGKGPVKSAVIGGGIAMTGGLLAAGGAYAAIRAAYQQIKRRQLEERLADAQQGFVDVLDQEKGASTKAMGGVEMATSLPVAATLLLGLGSAALTNAYLKRVFPPAKAPLRRDPKRIVIRQGGLEPERELDVVDQKPQPPENQDPDLNKEARDNGLEFLLRHSLMLEKAGSCTGLRDLVGALSVGRHDELVALATEGHDLDTILALTKGAGACLEEPFTSAAISLAVKSSAFRPVITALVAADFLDRCPSMTKLAAGVPESLQARMIDGICALGEASRHQAFAPYAEAFDSFESKEAAAPGILQLEDLLQLFLQQRGHREASPSAMHDTLGNSSSKDSTDSFETPAAGAEAQKPEDTGDNPGDSLRHAPNKDQIDEAFSSK